MSSSNELKTVQSVQEFNTLHNSKSLIVIHFHAVWAPQCQQINDVLKDLTKEKELQDVLFLMVEAEGLPELSLKYNITAVPTCVLIQNQKEAGRINGVDVVELSKKIRQLAPPSSQQSKITSPANEKESLNQRLTGLVNSAPVMIFIKGSPTEPKCGFSRSLVDILTQQSITFDSFDILTDESVRQGLKEFSNWPTFPQVYVGGELIGGLDIVKELVASGELKEMVGSKVGSGEESLEERLKKLVSRDEVMLFMKGSPDCPKCGFSKTITEILNETGVKYGHFDILTDDEVRQSLKTFSNWPTYPQLYVKGQLIGGLDIVKELKEMKELEGTLKGESS